MSAFECHNMQALLPSLPVVLWARGSHFKRLCRRLQAPFDKDFGHAMALTMLYAAKEIPDCCFGFQYSDQIFLILRHRSGQSPWHNNDIVALSSMTSSLATKGLEQSLSPMQLQTTGDALFLASAFNLPKLQEVVNYLVWKQSLAKKYAIERAARYFLFKNENRRQALEFLTSWSLQKKQEYLDKSCQFPIEDFPEQFWKGYGLYKIPLLLPSEQGVVHKNKWHLNDHLPIFKEDHDFVLNILKNGHDILRQI